LLNGINCKPPTPESGKSTGRFGARRDRIPGSTNFRNQRFTWEVAMPVYDYICNDCNKSFETVLTLGEHDAEKIKCPKCGSKNVEQEMAAFFAVTSKKS
jgi:putative FmdB family regulatory protein